MKWGTISLAVIAAIAGTWYVMQPDDTNRGTQSKSTATLPDDAMVAVAIPKTLSEQEQIGKRAFDAVCAT
jgi:hypothetical protein